MPTTSGLLQNRRTPLLTFALAGVVLWTFFPAVHNGFVIFDDPDYVTANAHVQQGLTLKGVSWAFAATRAGNWHPLTWISHQLDWQLFAGVPWGHHLSSVLLHTVNVVLIFLVFWKLTRAHWASFLVALLFGLHPLRVESVAWISERKDVLSTAFFLLSIWAYAHWGKGVPNGTPLLQTPTNSQPPEEESLKQRGKTRKKHQIGGPKSKESKGGTQGISESLALGPPALSPSAGFNVWYALAFAFFVLGLMCKQMLVTLPFVLLLLDFWPLGRWRTRSYARLVLEKIPFFMAALGAGLITLMVQRKAGAMVTSLPGASRLENAAVSYVRYVGKLFCPVDLAFFYPPVPHWPFWIVAGSVLVLIGISALAFVFRNRFAFFLVGWFWFVGTLIPVIGLVPAGEQSMADRYSYIPSLGLLCVLVWGAATLVRRAQLRAAAVGVIAVGIAALAVASALRTQRQIGYWKDDRALLRHALQVTSGNYVAHMNLGSVFDREGHFDLAIGEFEQALRIKPQYALARSNLGTAYVQKNLLDQGIAELRKAIAVDPKCADAHNALGSALERKGLLDEALEEYAAAVRLKPELPSAHYNLGLALMRKQKLDEAIREFQATIEQQPGAAAAHSDLGVALQQKGDLDGALGQFRQAVRISPNHPGFHLNLALALYGKGQLDQAVVELREAVRLKPDFAPAKQFLNTLLEKQQQRQGDGPLPARKN